MPLDIGRTKGRAQVLEEDLLKTLGAGPERAFRAVFIFGGLQLPCREIPGLVPGGGAPFAFAARAHPDHGLLQAIGIVDLLDGRVAPGAEHAAGFGVGWIGVQLVDAVAFDIRQHRALVGAELAGGGNAQPVGHGRTALTKPFRAGGVDAHQAARTEDLHEEATFHGFPFQTKRAGSRPPARSWSRTSLRGIRRCS